MVHALRIETDFNWYRKAIKEWEYHNDDIPFHFKGVCRSKNNMLPLLMESFPIAVVKHVTYIMVNIFYIWIESDLWAMVHKIFGVQGMVAGAKSLFRTLVWHCIDFLGLGGNAIGLLCVRAVRAQIRILYGVTYSAGTSWIVIIRRLYWTFERADLIY